MKTIKGDNFITRYDEEKQVLYGIFGAEATGNTTSMLYMAMQRLLREITVNEIQGIQFDLRRADTFSRDNLSSMQREIFRLNTKNDIAKIPIAYIVNSEMQEQIANLVIQMTPEKDRCEIVFSSAEALAYFTDWQDYHNAQT